MRKGAVWHPFTQHGATPGAIPIARAEGAWLETADGQRLFDAISSWWVITHGHRHPRIMAAIRAAGETLDQIIFAGFTHEPAERLAKKLLAVAPPGLAHVFYSDSGSTSVEVGLKMALGYWKNKGEERTRIIALESAYHGDTIGSMSVGERGVFNAAYGPLLFDVARIPFPTHDRERETLVALDELCRRKPAALIVEPLICGAGGMRMYEPYMLGEMKHVCERYGVLLIADEVMTGWGRTGTMFACEQPRITPDILCLAKGITGGALPLAATLCTADIYDAHYSTDRAKTFFHSSSYTANPIACAAAVANLEIWETEPVLERITALCERQADHLARLSQNPGIVNPRRTGIVAAFDLAGSDPGYLAAVGPRLYDSCLRRGVLIRPLGNTVYVMPPYCATAADLDFVYAAIMDAIAELP